MNLVDESKLNIIEGTIYYFIYAQNGDKIAMNVKDTPSNRRFVAWVQIHDN